MTMSVASHQKDLPVTKGLDHSHVFSIFIFSVEIFPAITFCEHTFWYIFMVLFHCGKILEYISESHLLILMLKLPRSTLVSLWRQRFKSDLSTNNSLTIHYFLKVQRNVGEILEMFKNYNGEDPT